MNHHPALGKILLMNLGAHAILYLAFSFQLCGFDATNTFVQETQSAKDLDLTCSTTFLFSDATCLQVGTMSLNWPVNPLGRFDSSRSSHPPEVPSGEQQRGAFPASTRSRWRRDALQVQPQILQRTEGWDGCGPFLSEGLRCITWNTRGLVGSFFSKQKNREFKLKYLKRLFDNNNIICLQEVHGKDEFLQAIQVLAPRFRLANIRVTLFSSLSTFTLEARRTSTTSSTTRCCGS